MIVPALILALVFWLDWLAGIFLLLSAPLIPLFMALVGMGAEKLNQQHFETISRLSGQFLDKVRGLTTLQLFGQTAGAAELIRNRSDHYRRITMKTLRVAFLSSAVLEFFASVAIAVIAIYIGFGLLGYITYGPSNELTLFTGLLILLLALGC
jgi:ATP-binding cassette subfamily C protein CydD